MVNPTPGTRCPLRELGGVTNVDDIIALRTRTGRAIHGAIIGRALYEGELAPEAALAAAAG